MSISPRGMARIPDRSSIMALDWRSGGPSFARTMMERLCGGWRRSIMGRGLPLCTRLMAAGSSNDCPRNPILPCSRDLPGRADRTKKGAFAPWLSTCLPQLPGDLDVGLARDRTSAWMVVRRYHGCGVGQDGGSECLPGPHQAAGEGAGGDHLPCNRVVLAVNHDDHELLLHRVGLVNVLQVFDDLPRVVENGVVAKGNETVLNSGFVNTHVETQMRASPWNLYWLLIELPALERGRTTGVKS